MAQFNCTLLDESDQEYSTTTTHINTLLTFSLSKKTTTSLLIPMWDHTGGY